ncbi:MAG: glycosyltransferase [Bacteroidales bacterium]|jgi:glycosyltransferase involved in cell wall biosynthesis|nr:glycosyltransferase [Bacteroidales bacterium]
MPNQQNSPRVVFSVTNCICFDQRVQKIAATLSNLGCEITIVGRHLGDCCESDNVPFRTHRFKMIFKRGFLFYKFINIRLFFFLLFHRFDVLVSNDLDTLLPNFLVSKLKRLPLIYDSHEYFTGVPEIQNRQFVKWVWTTIEKKIFPHLKYVITVSDSIAGEFEKQYGIKPVVIRNCARSSEGIKPFSRSELGVHEDHLLLILQGGGINIDRGGEELIEAVSRLEKVFLIIAGSGDVIDLLKEKTIALNSFDRIRFISKLPWEEMMRYTISADAGITLDKDTNQNYHFSLPNKLFDYISAGIPVIAGNLPEIRKIIDEHDCGLIVPSITPDEIGKAIVKLRDDRELLNKMKLNAVSASVTLNWDLESKILSEFYVKILYL